MDYISGDRQPTGHEWMPGTEWEVKVLPSTGGPHGVGMKYILINCPN